MDGAFHFKKFMLIAVLVATAFVAGCKSSKEPVTVRKQKIKGNLKVAVINCSGVADLARRVTFWLRDMGYDVIYYGSESKPIDKTTIIDHIKRNRKYGKMLGVSIGCGNIIYEPDPDSLFDVTLLIGKDYKKYFRDAARERKLY